MNPTEKYAAAAAALRAHELEHVKIQRQYEDSYAKLEKLNREVADAWKEKAK
jgi:hypothetical protein